MHYARKNSPRESGSVISDEIVMGRNWFFAFSTFTFKQGQTTKNQQINHFQCILYSFTLNLNLISYIQCMVVKVDTHFVANKVFFRSCTGSFRPSLIIIIIITYLLKVTSKKHTDNLTMAIHILFAYGLQ